MDLCRWKAQVMKRKPGHKEKRRIGKRSSDYQTLKSVEVRRSQQPLLPGCSARLSPLGSAELGPITIAGIRKEAEADIA
jgi:hypothetical protein